MANVCHNYLKNCDYILARCKDYCRIIVTFYNVVSSQLQVKFVTKNERTNKQTINNMIGNLIKTQSGVYAFNHNFPKHCKAEDFAIVNTSIEDLDAMYNEEKNCFVEAVNCSSETSRCVEIVAKSTEQEYIEYHKR